MQVACFVIVAGLSQLILAADAHAQPSSREKISRQAHDLWSEGNAAYDADDFKTAIRKFEQSRTMYVSIQDASNIAVAETAINASACEDRRKSTTDIDQLTELINPRRNWDSPYPGSCLPFREQVEYVKSRIAIIKSRGK